MKPKFQFSDEVMTRRLGPINCFCKSTVNIRNSLAPMAIISLLEGFFPNRLAMILWLIQETLSHIWMERKIAVTMRLFYFWHRTIMRRNASQIEVLFENRFVEGD